MFGPDDHLYVASAETDRILRYDGSTGAFIDAFVSVGSGGLNGPSGLTFGPDDYLYVGSVETDQVLRYDGQTGAFVGEFVSAGSGGLDTPVGLVFGPDKNLYVASASDPTGEGSILRYDGRTGDFIDDFVPTGRGGISGPRVILFKEKTRVCHHPPGNPAKEKTLTISYLSAMDHLAHGDVVGSCGSGAEREQAAQPRRPGR